MKTAQETFDTVVKHLATLSAPSASVEIARDGRVHTLKCFYRSPDGNKCAIGVLIGDDEYNEKIETAPAGRLADHYYKLDNFRENYAYNQDMKNLLTNLQEAHDNKMSWACVDRSSLKEELKRIAGHFNVSDAIVNEAEFVAITPLKVY